MIFKHIYHCQSDISHSETGGLQNITIYHQYHEFSNKLFFIDNAKLGKFSQ